MNGRILRMGVRATIAIVGLCVSWGAAAEERQTEPAPAEPAAPGIAELRREYEKIREAVFSSRARAAAVGGSLYSTKLEIRLRYDTPRAWQVRRATIRLDGANVFDDEEGQVAADDAPRFSGFVAPGRHLVTIRIEAQAKDDARFVYVTEDTLFVEAPKDRTLHLRAVASDEGDVAYRFPKKNRGSYKLRLDVDVEAKQERQR